MRQLIITKQFTNREDTSLDKYLHEIGKVELITAEEEVDLTRRIHKGDLNARNRLINANLRFGVSVAKQYQYQGLSLQDMINEGNIKLTLAPTTLRCPLKNQMVDEIKQVVGALAGVSSVDVQLVAMSGEERKKLFPKHPLAGIDKVKHTVAVASGKGGVGKTTVAVNVALALQKHGYKVGLLDADVYGPSLSLLAGVQGRPDTTPDRKIMPLIGQGMKLMSMAFFMTDDSPVIWRGPMVHGRVKQFLTDIKWGEPA